MEYASGEALLHELIEIAIPVCQKAERLCPRRGPGRRPVIPDWALAVLIIVAVLQRKTSKTSQYQYLKSQQEGWIRRLNLPRFPARSTYFDRYHRAWQLLERAIQLEGRLAIVRHWTDPETIAVDKSLIAAQGPPWHQCRGKRRRVRGADAEAGWGKNDHDGWVYGYGYEVVVSAPKQGPLWPLLASVDAANRNERPVFRQKIGRLPHRARHVLADRGYDDDAICEALEWNEDGTRTGRRFVCPLIKRRTSSRTWRRSHIRQRRWDHRRARDRYVQSEQGQLLYARRRQTVEPFNSWLKELFDLKDRVWHRGLDNNRTQLLAAVLGFQLLLHLNRRHRRPNGRVKWILDRL